MHKTFLHKWTLSQNNFKYGNKKGTERKVTSCYQSILILMGWFINIIDKWKFYFMVREISIQEKLKLEIMLWNTDKYLAWLTKLSCTFYNCKWVGKVAFYSHWWIREQLYTDWEDKFETKRSCMNLYNRAHHHAANRIGPRLRRKKEFQLAKIIYLSSGIRAKFLRWGRLLNLKI